MTLWQIVKFKVGRDKKKKGGFQGDRSVAEPPMRVGGRNLGSRRKSGIECRGSWTLGATLIITHLITGCNA